MNWDELYMSAAFLFAGKSKSPTSRHGAFIVSRDKRPISVGFNGIPRGVRDDVPERIKGRDRLKWWAHAERNALDNANFISSSCNGATMYITGCPCSDCAKGIIQCGVAEVIYSPLWMEKARLEWLADMSVSLEMLDEAGVKITEYAGPVVSEITGLFNGELVTFGKPS